LLSIAEILNLSREWRMPKDSREPSQMGFAGFAPGAAIDEVVDVNNKPAGHSPT